MDGTPYRAAVRLYSIASERWAEVEATYYQADILGYRIDRFFNLIFAWCVERVDHEKREEWELALDMPLPDESPSAYVSEASAEAEGALFLSAMQQHKALTTGK